MVIYRAEPSDPEAFVAFWAARYADPREHLYVTNIGKPLTADRVRALFVWKNGGKLSSRKRESVERNYVSRIDELSEIDRETTVAEFLDRFSNGGAIWRLFWLHCWQPRRYPIFDQHVWRTKQYFTWDKLTNWTGAPTLKKLASTLINTCLGVGSLHSKTGNGSTARYGHAASFLSDGLCD